jgi:hypothetical protein
MSEPSAPTLAARLTHLERAHRRLQRITLSALLLLATAVLIAAVDAGNLEGTSFKLLDAAGKVRILMTAASGLSFLDANGTVRAVVGVDGEGPGLVLYGDASRAILNINHDGPALSLIGKDAVRAVFGLVQNDPGLVLFDSRQNERAQLTVHGNRGAITLVGDDGKPLWQAPAAHP